MKKHPVLLILLIIASQALFSQAPQAFKYQAALRDNTRMLICKIIYNNTHWIKLGIVNST